MKTDVLSNTLKWLDHNRYTVISALLFAVLFSLLIGIVGCESQTTGLIQNNEGRHLAVNRMEFERQVIDAEKEYAIERVQLDSKVAAFNEKIAAFNKQVESGLNDLDQQDQFREQILDTIGLVATEAAEGSINPVSLIPIGIGLLGASLGLGTSADNRRKDQVISNLKSNPSTVGS